VDKLKKTENDKNENQYRSFEDIKHVDKNGYEYWFARNLATVLQYTEWRNFEKVLNRAKLACKNSGFNVESDFVEVNKIVEAGATTKKITDYMLSRYACYLIVQNGDPRKKIIATGQTYFAFQTRKQEISDYFENLDENNKRLVARNNIKQWNQLLIDSAHSSGVITNEEYAKFQNAGYMGLYGGLTVEQIHKNKGLKEKDKILDFMCSKELIANLFRISQTEEKLKKEKVSTAERANETHYKVGKIVRTAMKEAGGTMPEDMPTPDKSITEIEKEQLRKLKNSKKRFMLDE
jgi:DNA-damage-inducible protein D